MGGAESPPLLQQPRTGGRNVGGELLIPYCHCSNGPGPKRKGSEWLGANIGEVTRIAKGSASGLWSRLYLPHFQAICSSYSSAPPTFLALNSALLVHGFSRDLACIIRFTECVGQGLRSPAAIMGPR